MTEHEHLKRLGLIAGTCLVFMVTYWGVNGIVNKHDLLYWARLPLYPALSFIIGFVFIAVVDWMRQAR